MNLNHIVVMIRLGLAHASNYEIAGSLFPAWLIAIVLGVVLMVITRGLIARVGLAEQIHPPLFVYLSMALAFTFAIWLFLV